MGVVPCDIDENEIMCEQAFATIVARYRCEVCGKTKPQHKLELAGIPRPLEVCDRCLEANATPLWYAVSQAALVGGTQNLSLEGLVVCERATEYHNVAMEDFYDMVNDEMELIEKAGLAR